MSEQNNNLNIEEYEDELVTLTDEDGVETQFEYLMTVDHEGESYVLLQPVDQEENDVDEESGEVIVLKIEQDAETGEDTYVSLEDDDLAQTVFDKFLRIIEESEDEE